MKGKGLWIVCLSLLLLWPATAMAGGPALQAGGPGLQTDSGEIFVDEDVTLEAGETFRGDLGVFNGDLTIPADAVVSGDVFVVDGDIDLDGLVQGNLALIDGELTIAERGQVQGDVFVAGGSQEIAGRVAGHLSSLFGDVELLESAFVQGDLTIMSGSLERHPGARVGGQEMTDVELPDLPFLQEMPAMPTMPPMPAMPTMPAMPEVPVRPQGAARDGGGFLELLGRLVGAGMMSLLLIGLGLLMAFVWPRPVRRTADCIRLMPWQSLGLGLLTFMIAAGLEVLAVVLMVVIVMIAAALISTVILIPIGLLMMLLSGLILLPVPLVLMAAMGFGWVALAEVVGRWVGRLLRAGPMQPVGAVLVGLLVTVPLAALLTVARPVCCGWPFVMLLTSVGVGAVIHTRFGRQVCDRAGAPAAGPLPPEAMDEEAGAPDR
ncbi:MAG TPA: polymer-forming cytoskeletal protein [Anaerolineae bacterium]|nr:polymer-forming cytoskeletal protein [Anaerolineae bacterium]